MKPCPLPLQPIPVILISLLALLLGYARVDAAEKEGKSSINWQVGPAVAPLKNAAEIKLPKGYKFANAADTQRMLRAAGEPVSGEEMGMIVPEEGEWSVIFEFSDTGNNRRQGAIVMLGGEVRDLHLEPYPMQ